MLWIGIIEFGVLMVAFYVLRRSEVIGLKWDAIDFYANTIMIKHTVTRNNLYEKGKIISRDSTKTKSSHRTLPLVPLYREMRLQNAERFAAGVTILKTLIISM